MLQHSTFIRLRPYSLLLGAGRWNRNPFFRHRNSVILGTSCVVTAAILSPHKVRGCCLCESYNETHLMDRKCMSRTINLHQIKSKEPEIRWFRRFTQRVKETVFVIWRGTEIVLMFSPLVILAPAAYIASYANTLWKRLLGNGSNGFMQVTSGIKEEHAKATDELSDASHHRDGDGFKQNRTFVSKIAWSYTLFTLQHLGPAFVKIGQWAATRRDLFPLHFCQQLSSLHSQVQTHSFAHTQKALVDSFGENYESLGLKLNKDDEIIGSGSAAQVYKATMKTSTNETKSVAVKVLHPNIRSRVERDLSLMQYIANLIDQCIPLQSVKMLSLPRAVANFADIMRRQVDLRIEGNNLEIFRENFGCSSSSTVNFPQPQHRWVSEQVLVEDYVGDDARPISDYLEDGSERGLEERRALAKTFVSSALKMVFADNFVHSDLHSGT